MAATIPEPTINDAARTKAQLPIWIDAVNAMLKELNDADNDRRKTHKDFWRRTPMPQYTVSVGNGRKYIKIWCDNGSRNGSIYAFVRAADGAILKPAGRNAPTLNHIRGSIFDLDVSKAVSAYGVRYMDDPALNVGK